MFVGFLFILLFSRLLYIAWGDLGPECSALRDSFAESTSRFTSCAIQHSRPITLCENCVHDYISIVGNYSKMKTFLVNKTQCLEKLINLDRLQVIQTLYHNSYNLWNNAKCYECFKFANGTLTPEKSEQTIAFNHKFDKYVNCTTQSGLNDTTICPQCMDAYVDLDHFYTGISNENEKIGVCMDLVDLMNSTRAFWSAKCCNYRRHSENIFIASTVIVLLIPIVFYALTKVLSEKKTPTILQQTRFAGSLNTEDR